jgi:hypothetical protein
MESQAIEIRASSSGGDIVMTVQRRGGRNIGLDHSKAGEQVDGALQFVRSVLDTAPLDHEPTLCVRLDTDERELGIWIGGIGAGFVFSHVAHAVAIRVGPRCRTLTTEILLFPIVGQTVAIAIDKAGGDDEVHALDVPAV